MNVRQKSQMKMAHTWGQCFSDNCKFGYPRPKTDTDPKNYICKDKEHKL